MTKISIYADGGVIGPNPSAIGGTWAFTLVADRKQTETRSGVLTPAQGFNGVVSNNVSELFALVSAIDFAYDPFSDGDCFHIYSDSYISLLRVFRNGALNNVPVYLKEMLKSVQERLCWYPFEWTLLDGHPTRSQLAAGVGKRGNRCSEWNVWCDRRCNEEALKHRTLLAKSAAA